MIGFNKKTHFLARNGKNLAKRNFEPTMDKNTVIKKDLYFIIGFDAKRIFQREMVKSWQNAFFNLKWRKTHFSRKVVFHEWI